MKSKGLIIGCLILSGAGCAITVVIIIIAALVLSGNQANNNNSGVDSNTTNRELQTAQKYFDASKKYAGFTSTDLIDGGSESGEHWVDGNKFMILFQQENGFKRWVLSPDGSNVYFCYEEKKTCEPAVAGIDLYFSRWQKPAATSETLEYDATNSCQKYKYNTNKTYNIAGSSNGFENEYIIYCIQGDTIVYKEDKGYILKSDGTRSSETQSRTTFTQLKTGNSIQIPDLTLPYPVTNKR
ncbi:MAG: hypothetical protein WCJ58_04170 [bacterium]